MTIVTPTMRRVHLCARVTLLVLRLQSCPRDSSEAIIPKEDSLTPIGTCTLIAGQSCGFGRVWNARLRSLHVQGFARKLVASKHRKLYREGLQDFEAHESPDRSRSALMRMVR